MHDYSFGGVIGFGIPPIIQFFEDDRVHSPVLKDAITRFYCKLSI